MTGAAKAILWAAARLWSMCRPWTVGVMLLLLWLAGAWCCRMRLAELQRHADAVTDLRELGWKLGDREWPADDPQPAFDAATDRVLKALGWWDARRFAPVGTLHVTQPTEDIDAARTQLGHLVGLREVAIYGAAAGDLSDYGQLLGDCRGLRVVRVVENTLDWGFAKQNPHLHTIEVDRLAARYVGANIAPRLRVAEFNKCDAFENHKVDAFAPAAAKLEHLAFRGSGPKAESFALLAKLPRLRSLDLSLRPNMGPSRWSNASDYWLPQTKALFRALAELKQLESLSLAVTRLGDGSIPDLAKLTHLKRLDVSQTQLTKEGVIRLRKELPDTLVVHREGPPPAY